MDVYTLNLLGALATGCSDVQESAMAEAGLPPAELAALLAVFTRAGSTIGDIALTTGLTHSGTVRVVDRLAAEKLVERNPGRDRRAVAVRCTREGRAMARRALALRQNALDDITKGLRGTDAKALRRIASTLLAQLPEDRPAAWRICRLCDHGVCRGADCPVGSAVP